MTLNKTYEMDLNKTYEEVLQDLKTFIDEYTSPYDGREYMSPCVFNTDKLMKEAQSPETSTEKKRYSMCAKVPKDYCSICEPVADSKEKVLRKSSSKDSDIKQAEIAPLLKQYADKVISFAEEMANRLEQNQYKGRWEGESVADMLQKLDDTVLELKLRTLGYKIGNTVEKKDILKEAADAANYLMIICDLMGALK